MTLALSKGTTRPICSSSVSRMVPARRENQPDVAQRLGQDPLLPLAFVQPGVDQGQRRLFGGDSQALEFERGKGAVVLAAVEPQQPEGLPAGPQRDHQHRAVMQVAQDVGFAGMAIRIVDPQQQRIAPF
jgi:hypothetical protein